MCGLPISGIQPKFEIQNPVIPDIRTNEYKKPCIWCPAEFSFMQPVSGRIYNFVSGQILMAEATVPLGKKSDLDPDPTLEKQP